MNLGPILMAEQAQQPPASRYALETWIELL
jgi:hypothetical protein